MSAPLYPPNARLNQTELLYLGRKPVGKVKIDWSHPLAKGLKFYTLFDSLSPIDLVSGTKGQSLSSVNQKITVNGQGLQTHDDSNYISFSELNVSSGADIADGIFQMWGGVVDEITGSQDSAMVLWDVSDTQTRSSLAINGSSYLYNLKFGVNGSLAAGTSHQGYQTMAGEFGDNHVFYLDGAEVARVADPNSYSTQNLNSLIFSGYAAGFAYGVKATHLFACVYSRALSDYEIKSLHQNPYQFLIPARG